MSNPFKYRSLYHYYLTYVILPKNLGKVLDYGSGEGEFIGNLKTKTKSLYGFDVDKEKVQIARNKYPYVNFKNIKVGDKLPYKDDFFDVVCMFHVLEHVDSEEKAIKEIYRVLKNDGTFYLASPYKGLFTWADTANLRYRIPRIHRWFMETFVSKDEYKKKFLDKKECGLFGDCTDNRNWHKHYTEDEVRRILGDRFEIQKFHKFSLLHPFLLVIGNFFDYLFKNVPGFVRKAIWYDNKLRVGELSYNFLAVVRKK